KTRIGHGAAHVVGLVAEHEDDPVGMKVRERGQRKPDERPPAELVQDLGTPRPHPRAEAGGQDDRTERAATRHGAAGYHIGGRFASRFLQLARYSRTIGVMRGWSAMVGWVGLAGIASLTG